MLAANTLAAKIFAFSVRTCRAIQAFALQFSMRAGYTQNATSSKFSMGTTAAYAAILPHSTMRTTATKLARSTCLPVRTSIALSASMF